MSESAAAYVAGSGSFATGEKGKRTRSGSPCGLAQGQRLVSHVSKKSMPILVDWLRDKTPFRRFRKLEVARLAELYAVAFESTIIGAAIAVSRMMT